jgi:Outer membrane protein and related peptidoglycan-associated (lipo)proteins
MSRRGRTVRLPPPTSVKSALVSEFKIDASRLETDGKGESQPIDKNDNPAGKANNRRVEFIKK